MDATIMPQPTTAAEAAAGSPPQAEQQQQQAGSTVDTPLIVSNTGVTGFPGTTQQQAVNETPAAAAAAAVINVESVKPSPNSGMSQSRDSHVLNLGAGVGSTARAPPTASPGSVAIANIFGSEALSLSPQHAHMELLSQLLKVV